jgi:hypothetical protein
MTESDPLMKYGSKGWEKSMHQGFEASCTKILVKRTNFSYAAVVITPCNIA